MTAARAELERWYRRLLRAYPGSYRRSHGDDVVATLMDAAEPGRRRPARADVTDLARGALRQWFRLPVGVPPVVAAVLASLILAAAGASGGSWPARQTSARLPSDAAAARAGATVVGGPLPAFDRERIEGPGEIWPAVHLHLRPSVSGWTLAGARGRLRADGWTPGRVQADAGGRFQAFEATRRGQVLIGRARQIDDPGYAGRTRLSITVKPATPGWEPAAIVFGWVAGALLGWIITGRVLYRLRRRARPARIAALLLGLAGAGLAAQPTIGVYRSLALRAFGDIDLYDIAPPYAWLLIGRAPWLIAGALLAGAWIVLLAATGRTGTDLSRSPVHPAP